MPPCSAPVQHNVTPGTSLLQRIARQLICNVLPTLLILGLLGWLSLSAARQIEASRLDTSYTAGVDR